MTIWTDYRGRRWNACSCLATWLTAYQNELKRRGRIKRGIDVYQLIGNAGASASTHSTGGAFDIAQADPIAVWVARQMGADASWRRDEGFDDVHLHGVLRGCPHNGPARYQITAVDAGYNGLGGGGRGGPDDGPRPMSKRSWRDGIRWAQIEARKARLSSAANKRAAQIEAALARFSRYPSTPRWVTVPVVRAHVRPDVGSPLVKTLPTAEMGQRMAIRGTQTDAHGNLWGWTWRPTGRAWWIVGEGRTTTTDPATLPIGKPSKCTT